MSRRVQIALAVGCAVLAIGLWWLLHRSTGEEAGEAKPTARVMLVPLQSGPIAKTLEAYGVIEPAPGTDQVSAAPYDCLVSAVYVEAGAPVAAGDALLQIAPSPDSQLMFEAARSALLVADKALSATQERFDLKLATSQDLTVARQAKVDAQARVSSLEARGLGGTGVIRAIHAGIVSRMEVTRGSLVLLGAPLVSVAAAQGLEARLELEGGQRGLLARDQLVTLNSVDTPDPKPFVTRLRTVSAALNATAGTLEVRAAVPAAAPVLLGEHVRGLIEVSRHPAALIVPRSAVLPDEGAEVLYTVKDGKAVRHEVRLGLAHAGQVEVEAEGLKAGDAVVVTGNYELSDGMAVQADTPGDQADDAAAGATKDTAGADRTP